MIGNGSPINQPSKAYFILPLRVESCFILDGFKFAEVCRDLRLRSFTTDGPLRCLVFRTFVRTER